MSFTPFPSRLPVAAINLPLTLISLEDWSVATISGPDSEKYLQGQVTADVAQLTENQQTFAAQCDPKGKMWSNLRVFRQPDGFAWIQRKDVSETQLSALKKYAVFSKVTIAEQTDRILLGVAGVQARDALAQHFAVLPDEQNSVVNDGDTTLLWLNLPAERFLLVTSTETACALSEKLQGKAQFNSSEQWLALDIEAGLPVIDSVNSAQFIPQATNLQALDGISFRKGCYTGQETVARAKFRGANKRALWFLKGEAARVPQATEELELKMGENWRRTGSVLAAVRLQDNSVLVQVVMNNDIEPESIFRVRDDNTSQLTIQPLPYSLEETE